MLKQRDVCLISKDPTDGVTTIDMPITRIGNVEDAAKVATSGNYSDLSGTPKSLKNPQALTLQIGGVTKVTYDGSNKATYNVTLPKIPTSLKSPYALTIKRNGTKLGDYDGGKAVAVDIQQKKLTVNVNGVKVGEYNGDVDQVIDITVSEGAQPGDYKMIAGSTIPDGWLLCNGAAVSRTTYAKLFAAIGTRYGSGNGSTTFNLPNFNGRHVLGTTNTGNLGSYVSAGLPDITGYAEVRGIENDPNRISTGVFSVQTATNDAYSSHKPSEPNTVPGRLVFSASDSDSTYGRSYGVSVAAAYVLMIIKE
ncbi:phage tail protein [Duodenibacillus massiliensis]|uniref:phage tail protein n=1 Tax=Duodenibacillus massiliensis TaxID=1852381 RepID=UPI003F7E49D2